MTAAPELSWRRRIAALTFTGATAIAWVDTLQHDPASMALILVCLAAAGLALLSPHATAQVMARGVLWFHLGIGTIGSLGSRSLEPTIIGVLAGLALLSLGRASLSSPQARSTFTPVALRRTLIVALVAGIVASHAMAVVGVLEASDLLRRQGLLAIGFSASVLVAVYGVLRMRAWGVFLYLGSLIGAFVMFALVAGGGELAREVVGAGWDPDSIGNLWLMAGVALAIGAAPALWVRSRAPHWRREPGARAGLAHQALVGLSVLTCLVGAFTPG